MHPFYRKILHQNLNTYNRKGSSTKSINKARLESSKVFRSKNTLYVGEAFLKKTAQCPLSMGRN